jgi:hypothetical protein
MTMPHPVGRFRILTFILATLQLTSPAMVALADGAGSLAGTSSSK